MISVGRTKCQPDRDVLFVEAVGELRDRGGFRSVSRLAAGSSPFIVQAMMVTAQLRAYSQVRTELGPRLILNSRSATTLARAPCLHGEHTAEILSELGYSPKQIIALHEAQCVYARADIGGSTHLNNDLVKRWRGHWHLIGRNKSRPAATTLRAAAFRVSVVQARSDPWWQI